MAHIIKVLLDSSKGSDFIQYFLSAFVLHTSLLLSDVVIRSQLWNTLRLLSWFTWILYFLKFILVHSVFLLFDELIGSQITDTS